MTPQQKQLIKQIEAHRRKMIFPSGRPTEAWAYVDDLLALVKSQETLAHELSLIVDVGTCDDPGTALSKLHKIQHTAATSMRSACVEKVKDYEREHRLNMTLRAHRELKKLISDLLELILQDQETAAQAVKPTGQRR